MEQPPRSRRSPASRATRAPQAGTPPESDSNGHDWVSIADPGEDRTWMFDLSFLTSSWHCIFGQGCQGVRIAPAPELGEGCCTYGAHFASEEDATRTLRLAEELGDDEWQFAAQGRRRGVIARRGAHGVSRVVEGACIFLNRPGFPGGAGCALHGAALRRGVAPMTMKPEVCWQVPLRRQDLVDEQGHVTSLIGPWERRHWGPAGGEFAWWCTEAPEAYTSGGRVVEEMHDELVELVGSEVFALLLERIGPSTPSGSRPLRLSPRKG
jgi:hypothetical protein